MNKNKIIYSLNISDIQNVAQEELERELTCPEINLVVDEIQKRTPWYDIISGSIRETLHVQNQL